MPLELTWQSGHAARLWERRTLDQQRASDLRVLIVAEHASARFGGEAILPLHYFRVLRARGVDARLVTHARTRDELTARFPDDLDRIYFIPDSAVHRLMNRLQHRLPPAVHHFTADWIGRVLNQITARRLARRLVRRHQIDVVHQPIPVSPREASLLYDLGAPVVIGPMNGAMAYPPGFGNHQGRVVRWFTAVGRRLAELLNRAMPGKLRADMLLAANPRTRESLPAGARGRVATVVENGVDLTVWKPKSGNGASGDGTSRSDAPARFVFIGRLEDWKGVNLLLAALKGVLDQVPAALEVIGDGPMRASLEAQARELGLLDRSVRFLGWQPQDQAAERLRAADVLVLPSLHECGGAVVLEAMAVGLPVIATAWGGPLDYIDKSCGILVPPHSPEQFVGDLRDAMLRLAQSSELRAAMGRAGRQRVIERFDWDRKVDQMIGIYAEVARGRDGRRFTFEARSPGPAPSPSSRAPRR